MKNIKYCLVYSLMLSMMIIVLLFVLLAMVIEKYDFYLLILIFMVDFSFFFIGTVGGFDYVIFKILKIKNEDEK